MNWLDLAIIVVVAIGLIKGLFNGFIKQAISFMSLVLAIFFAGKTARPFRDMLVSHESLTNFISPQIITVICYILAFSLIILIFNGLSSLLNKIIKVTPISGLNYILGGFLGAFFSLFFLSLIFNVIICIDSNSKIISEDAKMGSAFFNKTEKLATFIAPLIKEGHHKENPPQEENPQEEKLQEATATK